MENTEPSPGLVCVAGLPRAGSTLLCQLLAAHPEIACEGHSSPLCNSLLAIRRQISADEFFLAQLDSAREQAYSHLRNAMAGFLRGWLGGGRHRLVVDKNRAWLHCIEMLLELAPESKVIVCLRDLTQITGSIEAQHQKTILLDFNDGLADYDRFGRADALFAKGRVIGDALVSINAFDDLPPATQRRIYFVRYEDLMNSPEQTLRDLFAWLGVSSHIIDLTNLPQGPSESDSHYRLKYPHTRSNSLAPAVQHILPERIARQIRSAYQWFYDRWYPER
jgi:sulfotransferase